MITRRPWELHAGNHVRWGGTVLTVLHEPVLDRGAYHVPARRSDTGAQVDAELPLNAEIEDVDREYPKIQVGDWNKNHQAGNPECPECWGDFPRECTEEGCGGLVHAEFGDESWDGYWLYYLCDRCESTSSPE